MFEPKGVFALLGVIGILALVYLNYRAYKTGDRDLILIGIVISLIAVSF